MAGAGATPDEGSSASTPLNGPRSLDVDPDGNIANWLMCQGGANLSTAKYCNQDVDKYLATAKSASAVPDRYTDCRDCYPTASG